MESIKEGSTPVDYSKFSDQELAQKQGKLERQKNSIENPLSSWTVVHKTDSMSETIAKVFLAVITLGLSVGIPTLLEFLFHKPDEKQLNEVQSEINEVATIQLQRYLEQNQTDSSTTANPAPEVSESPKVERSAPIDIDAVRAKRMRRGIEKEALKEINSREFKEQIMTVVKDDVSASMVTSYILGASSIDDAMETVRATRSLSESQLHEVEKILDKATSARIITEFGFLVQAHGLEFAQKVFPA